MRKLCFFLALLWLTGCSQPSPEVTTLLRHDFSAQLPTTASATPAQSKMIELPLGGASEPVVKITLENRGERWMKSVLLEVMSNPGGHTLQAELGEVINSGTKAEPKMSVPLKISWASGRKSRTDMFVLSASEGVVKQ